MLPNKLREGKPFFSLVKIYSMDKKFCMIKETPTVVISVAMGMDSFFLRGSSATLSISKANNPDDMILRRMAGNNPNLRDTKK